MILKPAIPGSIVRDPRTRVALPDRGMRVADTTYWRRRVQAGDAVVVKAEAVPEPIPAPSAPKKAKE